MDAQPDASQHEDVMAHMAPELTASMARVRQARQVLHEARDRLSLTRQEVEQAPHIERVRRARELLSAANDRLAQTCYQWDPTPPPNTAAPTTDDDPTKATVTP